MEWFKDLINLGTQAVSESSWAGLLAMFLVAALTEIGLPFPFVIDGVLFLTSYQNGLISFPVLWIILALTIGREVGAAIIYWLSRMVGAAFTNWLARRFPKWHERLNWLCSRFQRRAVLAVAIARLTPGLLTPSTVAAGCARAKYISLVFGIILASLVADGILVIIGFATKHGLKVAGVQPAPWQGLIAFFAVFAAVFLARRYWPRRRAKVQDH
jgi:membrane protein DedA with SNARE-associated domain